VLAGGRAVAAGALPAPVAASDGSSGRPAGAAGVREMVPSPTATTTREKADGPGGGRGAAGAPPAEQRASRPEGAAAPAAAPADRGALWRAILDEDGTSIERGPVQSTPRGRHIVDRRLPARGPQGHATLGGTHDPAAPLRQAPRPDEARDEAEVGPDDGQQERPRPEVTIDEPGGAQGGESGQRTAAGTRAPDGDE
jgi:hypothetical protein